MQNSVHVGKAHGRVNLIGEHTDYNGGWVLPTAIPQFTEVKLTPQPGQYVEITTSPDPKQKTKRSESYILGSEKLTQTWIDYLQGATLLLRKDGFAFTGFVAEITSTVPEGSGLSSSAALEIAFLKALRSAFQLPLEDVALARLGQRIENEFVGARVGIMDQMACSLARSGEALFLDTQEMTFEQVALPLDLIEFKVINSGISHRNVGGGYNQRRSECEAACAVLGVETLRELPSAEISRLDILPDVLKRRARHVVTENERVFSSVRAIREKNFERLGALFSESHASMRDDYEVSIPEIDKLVKICESTYGVYGARLTGGGFGGSVVVLTKKGFSAKSYDSILAQYKSATGETATALV